MTKLTRDAITAANRAAWNASAPIHEQGADWDDLLNQARKPGFSVLDPVLTSILKDLNLGGKTAAQVGCNNARELISLASLGIEPALGIDQSGAFLNQAEKLSDAAGLKLRLLEADIYDLPADVGKVDLVLITIGVINWMPDLTSFFSIVSDLLKPNGQLVIYETHPFLEVFDPESEQPFEPAFSYFEKRPQEVSEAIAYDGQDHGKGETGYWFIHTFGDIVTACSASGIGILELKEYAHTIREPEYDMYQNQSSQIPMCYSLVGLKL